MRMNRESEDRAKGAGNPVGWIVNGVFYASRVEADRAYRKTPNASVAPLSISNVSEIAGALKRLIDACSCVRPLSGEVAMDTVKQMRQAMAFMEAFEAARAALKLRQGEP